MALPTDNKHESRNQVKKHGIAYAIDNIFEGAWHDLSYRAGGVDNNLRAVAVADLCSPI